LGAWGTAIFADDTASDVRDEWRDAILDGLSPEDATQRVLESFDEYLDEAENEKLFWMALAAAQMETGRLVPKVRDRALTIIDGGGDVDRWRENGDAAGAPACTGARASGGEVTRSAAEAEAAAPPHSSVGSARSGRRGACARAA